MCEYVCETNAKCDSVCECVCVWEEGKTCKYVDDS